MCVFPCVELFQSSWVLRTPGDIASECSRHTLQTVNYQPRLEWGQNGREKKSKGGYDSRRGHLSLCLLSCNQFNPLQYFSLLSLLSFFLALTLFNRLLHTKISGHRATNLASSSQFLWSCANLVFKLCLYYCYYLLCQMELIGFDGVYSGFWTVLRHFTTHSLCRHTVLLDCIPGTYWKQHALTYWF